MMTETEYQQAGVAALLFGVAAMTLSHAPHADVQLMGWIPGALGAVALLSGSVAVYGLHRNPDAPDPKYTKKTSTRRW